MAALARNTPRQFRGSEGVIKSYPVNGGSRIYAGAIVMIDSDGYARPAAALAANKGCVGIAMEEANNTSGSDGTISVRVQSGLVLLTATSIAQANILAKVYASTDNDVDETQGTNEPLVGVLEEFVSSTSGWVRIGPGQVTAGL